MAIPVPALVLPANDLAVLLRPLAIPWDSIYYPAFRIIMFK